MTEPTPNVLPFELYRPIVQHLKEDRASLCAISLASKALQVEGERVLYETISSLSDTSSYPRYVQRDIQFFTTIIQCPRLASLVKRYALNDIVSYKEAPLWPLLCQGLKVMENLKWLSFRGIGGHPSAEILRGCTFQLDALHWGSHSDEEELSDLLPLQHSLKRLYVDWRDYKSGIFPPTALPDLQRLRGNRGSIETFLPGRCITSLSWVPDLDDPDGPVDHLSPEFNRLRALAYGGYFFRPALSLVIGHLQSLEVLELVGLFPKEINIVSNIPNLRVLVLSCHWGSFQYPIPPENCAEVIQGTFAVCKLLEHIDVQVPHHNEPATYKRWIPRLAQPLPDLISYGEVHTWWEI